MDVIALDNIPFEMDLDDLLERLRIKPGDSDAATIRRMAEDALAIGRPKGLCGVAYVESRGQDTVVIDGITFTSRVLWVNLDGVHRVFPFLITCGMELEEWSNSFHDVLERYWADVIKGKAMGCAGKAVTAHMAERYGSSKTAAMNPGSLTDWPIVQQRQLFDLLGSAAESIGVHLTDSFLMIPNKSVSGIRFPTDWDYNNCQLCPREVCPGRRAPYDRDLYEQKYL